MSALFIPVKSTYATEEYARNYHNEIVSVYCIPLSIISDRGGQFTSYFWKAFQKGLYTQVKLCTTFYPHIDGQEERKIHTLENIARACVIDFMGSFDDHLPLI